MNSSYIKIAPSILSCNFSELKNEIVRLDNSSADYIHIDVMDGHFVPNLTLGPDIIKSFRSFTKKIFDVHLMIERPDKYLTNFIDAGSDIIGIHDEISIDKIDLLKKIRGYKKRSCIVFNPDNDLKNVEEYLPFVDQILVMSVFPGFGGQKFIESSLAVGRSISKLIRESGYTIDLQIDGGISSTNSKAVIDAGYNVLVSGSYLFKSNDLENSIESLRLR